MIFAAGVLTGILSGTGMIKAMAEALVVPGHEVGVSRLVGGRPPSAL